MGRCRILVGKGKDGEGRREERGGERRGGRERKWRGKEEDQSFAPPNPPSLRIIN